MSGSADCLWGWTRAEGNAGADVARCAEGVGTQSCVLTFPDYGTSIGEEIAALQGERDYGPDVMQLLHRQSLRAEARDGPLA